MSRSRKASRRSSRTGAPLDDGRDEARDVAGGELGRAGETLPDHRHGAQGGDPVALDRGQVAVRVEVRLQHQGAAPAGDDLDEARHHPARVHERDRHEHPVPPAEPLGEQLGLPRVEHTAVGEQGTLLHARRAGRVADERAVVVGDGHRRHRAGFHHEVGVGPDVGGVQGEGRERQLLGGGLHEVGEGAVHDDDLAVGVDQQRCHLRRGEAEVQGDADRAELEGGEGEMGELRPVHHERADPVAVADALRGEAAGERVGPGVHLAPGLDYVAEDQRRMVGPPGPPVTDEVDDVHRFPLCPMRFGTGLNLPLED